MQRIDPRILGDLKRKEPKKEEMWEQLELDIPDVDIEYQESNEDDDCGDACKI